MWVGRGGRRVRQAGGHARSLKAGLQTGEALAGGLARGEWRVRAAAAWCHAGKSG
jgi:hypothetical protein